MKKVLKVKDTYLSKVRVGDVLMFVRGEKGDWLGHIIVWGSGNKGRDRDGDGKRDQGHGKGTYTHTGWIKETPDPEAEVKEVGKDDAGRIVYEVIDPKKAGVLVHATWPKVKAEPVKWGEKTIELWRIRAFAHEFEKYGSSLMAQRCVNWASERIGRVYNIVQFLTFGFLRLSFSWVCSGLVFRPVKRFTRFISQQVILSPEGRFDKLPTPNDLVNSGKMYRVRFTGLLSGEAKKN